MKISLAFMAITGAILIILSAGMDHPTALLTAITGIMMLASGVMMFAHLEGMDEIRKIAVARGVARWEDDRETRLVWERDVKSLSMQVEATKNAYDATREKLREVQAKLNAVLKMLEPGTEPMTGRGHHINSELRHAAWCTKDNLHAQAKAIMEADV